MYWVTNRLGRQASTL